MAIIDTALVSNGNLLIQLDDGTVVNAGRVAGPQGPAGRDGQDGSPGIPGAKGDAGENGAKWHTGVGAPEVGLGENGDLYMDVASALLPIYQKVNRDWLFLANLKPPAGGVGGGGGGAAAGDGGAIIIYPSPNGGGPNADNEGKPIDKGDLWFDPDTGYIYVYDGTNWVPVGDRPPVSISPTPPLWNPAGDTDNRYPIVDGNLWLDPNGNILYIYRDGAWSEITGCTGGNAEPECKFAGTPELTDTLSSNPSDPLSWIPLGPPNAYEWSIKVSQSLHNNQWPQNGEEKYIYVNGVEYPVIGYANQGGYNYLYQLAEGSLDALVGQEVTVALCPPEDQYLGRYGDTVDDADGPVIYDWNEPVTFQHGPTDFSKSTVKIESAKIAIESNNDMDVFAPNGDLNISIDGGTLGIGGFQELIFDYDGTKLVGDIKDSTHEKHIVDKKYVNAQDEKLQLEITELEEEINAIAPTVQRGTWAYNANAIVPNTAPGDGNFYLQEDGSTVVTDYPSANRVFLSKKNSVGDDVAFASIAVDQLIGLFDADDNDYLIGTITAVDASNSAYVQIDFTFDQGEGAPEDTKLARLNIFDAPSGGNGSEFLPLAGGNMTGAININPTPYNGISVFGKDGPAYNNGTKLVFRAENGGSYTDPLVIIGVEPTADNHATTKKYVDDKFDFSQYAELS